MTTRVRWTRPPSVLRHALRQYGDRVLVAVNAVAGRIATVMQNDARRNAPWTDRTGNARIGLFGATERDMAQRLVTIYLSHGPGLDYPKWLELAHGGRYAILARTIEQHLPQIRADLDAIFR